MGIADNGRERITIQHPVSGIRYPPDPLCGLSGVTSEAKYTFTRKFAFRSDYDATPVAEGCGTVRRSSSHCKSAGKNNNAASNVVPMPTTANAPMVLSPG